MHEVPAMQRFERGQDRQRNLDRFGANSGPRASLTASDSPSSSSMARNSTPFSSLIS